MPMALLLMRPSSAVARFVTRGEWVIPVRTQRGQARDEQPMASDDHLGIGRLQRDREVVEAVATAKPANSMALFHHPERTVAEPVHDPVADEAVV
jgi:hypothetical protein